MRSQFIFFWETYLQLEVIMIMMERKAPVTKSSMRVEDIPLHQIKRPLPRATDNTKVEALMASIAEIGLQEPIDILEVDGQFYGFSGCHRFEAHQRLGKETIRCRIRRAPRSVLKMHMA